MVSDSVIQKRHKAIANLVQKKAVTDQDMLVELLDKDYDIQTSQAVVSRDIRVLGIVKRMRDSQLIYSLPQVNIHQEILERSIVDMQSNTSLIIIHTIPGIASFVADHIDAQEHDDIAGTIAGENTIFVAPAEGVDVKKVQKYLQKFLFFKSYEKL